MREHGLSEEELASWDRDYDRAGIAGLRATQRALLEARRPPRSEQVDRGATRNPHPECPRL